MMWCHTVIVTQLHNIEKILKQLDKDYNSRKI